MHIKPMEFKKILAKRRSVRKFSPTAPSREVLLDIVRDALTAPSSRNMHTTRFLIVDDKPTIEKMASLRDYGSSFMSEATAAIVVMGDEEASPMWQINATIMATVLQLALVEEGLASCWVHVGDYLTINDDPASQRSEDYVKEVVPEIPSNYRILCVISIGYADYTPKPLPDYEGPERIMFAE